MMSDLGKRVCLILEMLMLRRLSDIGVEIVAEADRDRDLNFRKVGRISYFPIAGTKNLTFEH